MTLQKRLTNTLLVVTGLLCMTGVAYAQTTYTSNGTSYTVPAGYQSYNYGTYYNPSTGTYYNPTTGQTSQTAPTGPTMANSSNYSIPSGYQSYNNGTYYNPSTGTYYNPATGQTSSSAPTGPAASNGSGGYVIPPGYNQSTYGTYYNSSTGQYYDPRTGFYSTTAPIGPTYNPQTTYTSNGTSYSIPSGYTPSSYGTYYNSNTGTYYDPVTGFTSTSAPTGPVYASSVSGATTVGLPNTGVGPQPTLAYGIAVLLLAAVAAFVLIRYKILG